MMSGNRLNRDKMMAFSLHSSSSGSDDDCKAHQRTRGEGQQEGYGDAWSRVLHNQLHTNLPQQPVAGGRQVLHEGQLGLDAHANQREGGFPLLDQRLAASVVEVAAVSEEGGGNEGVAHQRAQLHREPGATVFPAPPFLREGVDERQRPLDFGFHALHLHFDGFRVTDEHGVLLNSHSHSHSHTHT